MYMSYEIPHRHPHMQAKPYIVGIHVPVFARQYRRMYFVYVPILAIVLLLNHK